MVSTISVIGLGKLGTPIAACFAARDFQIIAVDIDAQKVDAIGRGVPPVREPGLAELLQESRGRLIATQDTEAAVRDSEATFIVVGTPSEADGGFSLRYAVPTCEAIGRALRNKDSYHLVVLTSTVMPGSTGGAIKLALERASGKRCGQDFGLCYSPEFIALGTVIRDFYYPDFLLIGESDLRAGDLLSDVYARTCKNSPTIARMNFINAEITKLAVNTYITTKISYANMLARLCEKLPEADVSVVTYALGLDSRTMQVEVTIGVQQPDKVDAGAVKAVLPHGQVAVTVVKGGLDVPDEGSADAAVIASAAVAVRMNLPQPQ